MQEIVIQYNNSRTLNLLKDLAKYFDFVITPVKSEKKKTIFNGVTVIPADSSIDISYLTKYFTGKNIDSAKHRKRLWQRRK